MKTLDNIPADRRLGCLLTFKIKSRFLWTAPFRVYVHKDNVFPPVSKEVFLYLGPEPNWDKNEKLWSLSRNRVFYTTTDYLECDSFVLSLSNT